MMTMSRRLFAACRLFFEANIVSIKETLDSGPTAGDAIFSHGGENLLEGQIRLFCNQSQIQSECSSNGETRRRSVSAPHSLSHSSVGTIELPN
jgi:hypothetical protein